MPELRELFDAVADHVEPDLDAWSTQQQRQRGWVRRRRGGAVVLAAAISTVMVALIVRAVSVDRDVVGTPTEGPRPSPTPASAEDTRLDLFVFDPESSRFDDVLRLAEDQSNPEMSPDGSRIVFEGIVDGMCCQLFVLEGSGEVRQLTTLPQGAQEPTWSPDGRQIAFVDGEQSGDIWVMNADGSGARELGGTPSPDGGPDWSPDGSAIVFYNHAASEVGSGLFTVAPDDGLVTRLTRSRWGDVTPGWSPDGTRIVFVRYDAAGSQLEFVDTDLWVMRADGSGQRRLVRDERQHRYDPPSPDSYAPGTPDGHFQHAPVWSPDGRLVAFTEAHCDCITTIDVARGRPSSIDDSIGLGLKDISWNPDGTILGSHADEDSSYFDDIG